MGKMSVLELLFALLLVCLLAGLGLVGALVWSLVRRAEGQAADVAELKARLQTGGQTQESQAAELRERLSHTQAVVEGMRSALSARQPIEEEARASLRRLRSEEHTSELQSRRDLVCRLLLEKKKNKI